MSTRSLSLIASLLVAAACAAPSPPEPSGTEEAPLEATATTAPIALEKAIEYSRGQQFDVLDWNEWGTVAQRMPYGVAASAVLPTGGWLPIRSEDWQCPAGAISCPFPGEVASQEGYLIVTLGEGFGDLITYFSWVSDTGLYIGYWTPGVPYPP